MLVFIFSIEGRFVIPFAVASTQQQKRGSVQMQSTKTSLDLQENEELAINGIGGYFTQFNRGQRSLRRGIRE
jgi:hypothetical protein